MISYEVFMGLALMGIFMVYGTTRVSGIVEGQNEYWFGYIIPMWGVFTLPLGFVFFFKDPDHELIFTIGFEGENQIQLTGV